MRLTGPRSPTICVGALVIGVNDVTCLARGRDTAVPRGIGMSVAGGAAIIAVLASAPALAQLRSAAVPSTSGAGDSAAAANVFTLGEVQVTARKRGELSLSSTTLSTEKLRTFAVRTPVEALNLIPGTVGSQTGGSRNEGVIYIRGFDRFETTLSIDGIKVYLPADNRLDFNRFLTEDLSEIQVAKGYVSVINGPGAMGGAINLVTRKPTAALNVELWTGSGFDNNGSANGYNIAGVIGTRADKYYFQVSGSRDDYDHFRLSDDYTPTSVQGSGERAHSYNNDWRMNLKAGWTPNDRDEYSINYIKQDGAKGAPYSIYDPIATQKYWDWPVWNINSIYALTHTQLSPHFTLDGKAYYNQFVNDLFSYSDAAQTLQNTPKAFRSYYDDSAYGGSLAMATDILPRNTLKGLFDFREDRHVQYETTFSPTIFTQPDQTSIEDTYSLALEDTFHPTAKLDIDAGLSYDWRRLLQAEDYNAGLIHYPLANSDALNGQAAVTYHISDTSKIYADVSDRTRFPTLFDRFSSRFGGAISNPGLRPERAANYEFGGSTLIAPRVKFEGAAFYSDVQDIIVSVPLIYEGTPITQSQNVGHGQYYGFETAVTADVTPTLDLGANYTFIRRIVDNPATPGFELIGVPASKSFIYADWRLLSAFTITPSLDIASSRYTTNTAGTAYFKTGSYVLANLGMIWHITNHLDVQAGLKNIFDRNYQLAYGYPEAGRTEYATLHFHL
jgi:iron complex outermembrane receptor protein